MIEGSILYLLLILFLKNKSIVLLAKVSYKKAFYFVQQSSFAFFSSRICAISNREGILFCQYREGRCRCRRSATTGGIGLAR